MAGAYLFRPKAITLPARLGTGCRKVSKYHRNIVNMTPATRLTVLCGYLRRHIAGMNRQKGVVRNCRNAAKQSELQQNAYSGGCNLYIQASLLCLIYNTRRSRVSPLVSRMSRTVCGIANLRHLSTRCSLVVISVWS